MALYGNLVCPMLGALTTDGWGYAYATAMTSGGAVYILPTATVTWGTPSSGYTGGKIAASNQPVISVDASTGFFAIVYVGLADAALGTRIDSAATSGADWLAAHRGAEATLDDPVFFTEPGTYTLTSMLLSVDWSSE